MPEPTIKIETKETERPVIKVKNLPMDKNYENFAIKDDNSDSDISFVSYKKTKKKKKKKKINISENDLQNRFDVFSNPKKRVEKKIINESDNETCSEVSSVLENT